MTDEEVIRYIQEGHGELFEVIHYRWAQAIDRYVKRNLFGTDDDEREDVVQEVFVLIHSHIHSFDPQKGKFQSWIYRIAHNTTINAGRDKQKRRHASIEEMSEIGQEPLDDARSDESASSNESGRNLRRMLGLLSPAERRILEAFYSEGMSYREIAAMENCTTESLSVRIQRAKNKLKKLFNEDGTKKEGEKNRGLAHEGSREGNQREEEKRNV